MQRPDNQAPWKAKLAGIMARLFVQAVRDPQVDRVLDTRVANRHDAGTAFARRRSMFQTLSEPSELKAAWVRVLRNGGAPGGDGMRAADFAKGLEDRLARLSADLRNGRYRPGSLRIVEIPKRDGRMRVLRIPGLADRVVQTSAQRLLSSALDERMNNASFGYRPARSVAQAIVRVKELAVGQHWVLDADIRAFFDEVPHDRLLDELSVWIQDTQMIRLVELWLSSFDRGRGLAQGAPISPILANLYLHPLDTAFARAGIAYVRYADDFVALTRTKRAAVRARDFAEATLKRRGLALQGSKTRIIPLSGGLQFLGTELSFRSKRR